ncbi:transporter [Lichenihabitans sp. PAMC28606]|uniref:transporter n=1 Tax=Lichenihabitans sp. PAMC28606 TaxID=2880932 RepID=UPI0022239390|nr:transporter [Lichenihabitans sp. PAMC28606]
MTVDAGRYQIESDFLAYSFSNQQGATTKTYQALDPVLKLGITSYADIEVAFAGFNDLRTTANGTGATIARGQGFGDVTLTAKFNVVGNEGGNIAFAIAPYLIVPGGTHNITAGQVEGGVIAPLVLSLPDDFSMTLQTELDALANVNLPGTHVNFTNIVNVSHAIPGIKNLTGTAEFYSSLSTEVHAPDIYTADLALAYLVETNTQLDVGVNIGLNRGAPDYQIYSGIAHRF